MHFIDEQDGARPLGGLLGDLDRLANLATPASRGNRLKWASETFARAAPVWSYSGRPDTMECSALFQRLAQRPAPSRYPAYDVLISYERPRCARLKRLGGPVQRTLRHLILMRSLRRHLKSEGERVGLESDIFTPKRMLVRCPLSSAAVVDHAARNDGRSYRTTCPWP